MIPVPDVTGADVVFGGAKKVLPPYDKIPDEYKGFGDSNPYIKFVSGWFFEGRKPEDMKRLKERDGVDRMKALAALKAALSDWGPKHEHKTAGCAYLLSEWFELSPPPAK